MKIKGVYWIHFRLQNGAMIGDHKVIIDKEDLDSAIYAINERFTGEIRVIDHEFIETDYIIIDGKRKEI